MADKNREVAELMKLLPEFVEAQIPFNRVLGLRVESLEMDRVCLKIEMKEELIGNPMRGILHGGVISSLLDVTGGMTAAMGVLKKLAGRPFEEIGKRLLSVGTIDLRIDFLRPGRGQYFLATGSIMRTGQKVAVIRMQLHNDQDLLIAVGTGTYTVG
ncbi:MAG: thioesterase family protein [Desulfobacteraceae bacterium]|jgi:uncharacterized protein (TIGR00369 family)